MKFDWVGIALALVPTAGADIGRIRAEKLRREWRAPRRCPRVSLLYLFLLTSPTRNDTAIA